MRRPFFPLWMLLSILTGSTQIGTAQISQGGQPWKWGLDVDMTAIPVVSTEALDLNELAAEDAVTDHSK